MTSAPRTYVTSGDTSDAAADTTAVSPPTDAIVILGYD